jgi:hypothetical protein
LVVAEDVPSIKRYVTLDIEAKDALWSLEDMVVTDA